MDDNRKCFPILAGILWVSVIGTLAHFLYGWTGQNPIIGLITPVNESIWEHIKLLFFPMLFYSLYLTYRLKNQYTCILSALSAGILFGSLLIPVIYYFYTGILGYHLLLLDIATFYLSVIAAFLVSCRAVLNPLVCRYKKILLLSVIFFCILFFLFTYAPPDIPLFAEPSA